MTDLRAAPASGPWWDARCLGERGGAASRERHAARYARSARATPRGHGPLRRSLPHAPAVRGPEVWRARCRTRPRPSSRGPGGGPRSIGEGGCPTLAQGTRPTWNPRGRSRSADRAVPGGHGAPAAHPLAQDAGPAAAPGHLRSGIRGPSGVGARWSLGPRGRDPEVSGEIASRRGARTWIKGRRAGTFRVRGAPRSSRHGAPPPTAVDGWRRSPDHRVTTRREGPCRPSNRRTGCRGRS